MKLSLDIVENNVDKSLYSPLTLTKEEEGNLKQWQLLTSFITLRENKVKAVGSNW